MIRKVALGAGLSLGILMVAVPSPADFTCTRYQNSTTVYYQGHGWACAETGLGCRECINFHPGGVQWCHWGTPTDIYCVDQAY